MTINFVGAFIDGDKPLKGKLDDDPRQEFRLGYPNGDYIAFSGMLRTVSSGEEVLGQIQDVRISERGNIYDRQGAD